MYQYVESTKEYSEFIDHRTAQRIRYWRGEWYIGYYEFGTTLMWRQVGADELFHRPTPKIEFQTINYNEARK